MKRRLALTVNVLQPQYADLLGPLYDAGMEIDYIELMSTTDQDRVARELRGYDYVLAASEIFGDTSIPRLADSLKLIARNGVGVESVDIGLCTEYNIAVANMPGMNADGVGEYCISALLALLRNVCKNNAAMHAGQWCGFPGRSFTGTLGLIGFGAIAQSFARFCAGFPVDVVAYDMNPDPARAAELGVTLVSLEELLARADFVSLHLPLTGSTRHFVDGAMFSRMKRGAYFINTSRGPVADEQALIRALQDGQLQGAVLDVFETEPVGPDNPLLAMDNVMLSSHTAAGSLHAQRKVLQACCDTILDYHRGTLRGNVINRDKVTVRR